jgi:predicted helicase
MSEKTMFDIRAHFREEAMNNRHLGGCSERDQITIVKGSAVKNTPNDWCKEYYNPHYIMHLVKGVTHISLQTMEIVNALPALNESGGE